MIYSNLTLIICSMIATCAFAVVFNAPLRIIPFCAILGAVSYFVFLWAEQMGLGGSVPYFLGTFAMAMLCEACAIFLKAPVTILVCPSMLTLVPGYDLYRTMSLFTQGNFDEGILLFIQTMIIVAAMATAIALSSFFMRIIRKIFRF